MSDSELQSAAHDMLAAFSEGVVWNDEQRTAYTRLAQLLGVEEPKEEEEGNFLDRQADSLLLPENKPILDAALSKILNPKPIPNKTTVSLFVVTDDDGNRSLDTAVFINNADRFHYEEEKEESTAADINWLFDQIDKGELNRASFV